MRKKYFILGLLSCIILLSGCTSSAKKGQSEIIDEKTFIDDVGNQFVVEQPYERIVTMYSAHTENLFSIGAEDQIIGTSKTSIYPPKAAFLPRYDYKSDPEPLIALNPDLVIIRPFINRNYPDYVKALERSGLTVVSLYPESNQDFEKYVTILGMLTGKEKEVAEQIEVLNRRLEEIQNKTSLIEEKDKKTVFFESTKTAYRTVTLDSNPAKAIEMAGGINVATDAKPIEKGSTISEYGIEQLMINADQIDCYVSQRGAMNSGGSMISIPQREGFMAIKAVKEGQILEINEKIISSPTFRYYKGVNEIARKLYPSLMDDVSMYGGEDFMTREAYADFVVKYYHLPIFIPSSSHYYETKHYVHDYGLYKDVEWTDSSFDAIETATINSLVNGKRDEEGIEYYDKSSWITKEDVAYTLYIKGEYNQKNSHVEIKDLEKCQHPTIIQKLVDHGIMMVDEEGHFNPEKNMTQNEIINYLNEGQKYNNEEQ